MTTLQDDKTLPRSVAVVEDEQSLRTDLVDYLTICGYQAFGAASVAELRSVLESQAIDVVVLDVNLPDGDGYTVARALRAESEIGIVMLTYRTEVTDRVQGLDSGADAYLVKDVDLREIEATVRSVLRRVPISNPPPVGADSTELPWRLNVDQWYLCPPLGTEVRLTASELAFLRQLVAQGGVVRREELIGALPAPDRAGDHGRNLNALVRRLRRKVEQEANVDLPVRMVYGVGYTFIASAELLRD
jgi:two-component system, OmpR family, response regulator